MTTVSQFEKRNYSGRVIARMLNQDEKALEEWLEDYEGSKITSHSISISSQERKMAEEYWKGMGVHRLMKDYNVGSTNRFWKIIAYVEGEKNGNTR